ncbi:glucose-induced degradation protein 8-B homolog [Physella acuta]|uniref:glucose-induced degradation protein 8-B homolog n=1 Tax=Physella acuta TaxID=109671 RepID=UPI0027DC5613|nr:glucose-induced degradation protein 8-B homolog [Physella acuta]XP_059160655.1 glucose-induced degradation protein 8-B homolog [Physella acuta]XP_059160656.1 glucose-induced degradation protein 8-B homolog [Physella acuta]XP_059160657.1 glucose-induced degradation protein 8-B homolog [Physella acuta]
MSSSSDRVEEKLTRDSWMKQLMSQHVGRADMNKLIMNYLVTEGFKEAAEKFSAESGVTPTVNLDSLDDRIRIRQAILEGRVMEAIAIINSLYPELLDNDRYLFFRLQQQQLIELIKKKDLEKALNYAQSRLSERVEENPNVLPELEKTLALLAFDNPEHSPFGELLHPSQRQKVASEVNAAILETDATPRLANLLKLLLWAQEELDKRKVPFPHMINISEGTIEDI